jgi:TonB family protein
MRRDVVQLWKTVSAAVLLGVAVPAWPDMYSATTAYQKGDFTAAFKQFKELAELGKANAQFNIAVMYAKGEGVAASNVLAHAWASIAGQNGEEPGKVLAAKLELELTPNSLRFSKDLQTEYSPTALNARLLPLMLKDKEYEDRDPAKLSKPYRPPYPVDAQSKGVQGEAFVEFTVAPDGHPRSPRILYAVPPRYFEDAIRESVLRTLYLPARINGRPVATSTGMFFNFKIDSVSLRNYRGLAKQVEDAKIKAEAGDPSAQMLYGMMLAGLPQLNQHYTQALPWFLKAAQAGAPYAQYQVGTALLRGHGCQCESVKGEIWLQKAAQADEPNAQVSLAEYLLQEHTSSESVSGALVWLERATKQNNSAGKYLLASVLASSPDANVRDPARALALADAVERDYKRDPSLWEISAAAYAARSNYSAAKKAQAHAIEEAKALGWDLEPMLRRESLYAARQPWTGDLLGF